ncbi:MAG: thioredoxin [Clostridia bacterium]|jgi:thioredoxin 1
MADAKTVAVSNANFDEIVLKSAKPVLVDFWASWCGPCRMVGPIMEQLAEDFYGKVTVAKVNVDEESELSTKFRIMSIPTVMLFKDGVIAEKVVGARSKEEFTEILNNNIK